MEIVNELLNTYKDDRTKMMSSLQLRRGRLATYDTVAPNAFFASPWTGTGACPYNREEN